MEDKNTTDTEEGISENHQKAIRDGELEED